MDEQNHIDEQLLLNYFVGSLSQEQIRVVDEWIQASDVNQKMARDIQYLYLACDTLDTLKKVDAAQALINIKSRIIKPNQTSYLIRCQRIAAILILPLLISTTYLVFKKEPIEYIEIRTNPGMVATVNLPDGSKVWLNSRSYLRHPHKFIGNTRNVEIEGEAYFSVNKHKSKKFIVQTPFNFNAEVLGTEFNIEAYKANRQIITTLVSGSVKLSYQSGKHKEDSLIMRPNDKVSYHIKTGQVEVNTSFVPIQTAWKDGLVIFRNTPFDEALKILSKRFNVEFIIKNDLLYENSFTGSFDSQHLDLILEHFRLSSDIQYKYIDPELGENKISEKTVVELY